MRKLSKHARRILGLLAPETPTLSTRELCEPSEPGTEHHAYKLQRAAIRQATIAAKQADPVNFYHSTRPRF